MKKNIRYISVLLVSLFLQVIPTIQEELFWVFNDKG